MKGFLRLGIENLLSTMWTEHSIGYNWSQEKWTQTVFWFHRFTRDSALTLEKIFSRYIEEWIDTTIIVVLTDFTLAQLEKLGR